MTKEDSKLNQLLYLEGDRLRARNLKSRTLLKKAPLEKKIHVQMQN